MFAFGLVILGLFMELPYGPLQFFAAGGAVVSGDADPGAAQLKAALLSVAQQLAQALVRDGEGATKMIEVTVRNAPSEEDAAEIARTVVGSPLVKTAVYGEDPNWGRLIAAAGRAGVVFDPDAVTVMISDGKETVLLARKGEIMADDKFNPAALSRAKELMKGKKIIFEFDLDYGKHSATAWGCDLTEKYVEINGKYTT